MKKTVSISITSEVWDGVKEAAWRQKKSASQYLEDLITVGFKGKSIERSPQEKLDVERNAEGPIKKAVIEREKAKAEDAELLAANERLKKKRTEIKGAIKTVSEIPGPFFNPQPKIKDKGGSK